MLKKIQCPYIALGCIVKPLWVKTWLMCHEVPCGGGGRVVARGWDNHLLFDVGKWETALQQTRIQWQNEWPYQAT